MEDYKVLAEKIVHFEKSFPSQIIATKEWIENGNIQLNINSLIDELNVRISSEKGSKKQYYLMLHFWILFRYGIKDNFKIWRGYFHHNINNGSEKSNLKNSVDSEYSLNEFLLKSGNMGINDLKSFSIEMEIDDLLIHDVPKKSTKILKLSIDKLELNSSKKVQVEKCLTIDEIALKHVYEGFQITRDNASEIIKRFGHNSGEKLFQRFTYYSSTSNRKGRPNPCTQIKLKNKIDLIERVIELLPEKKKSMAQDELAILRRIQESEYPEI